ncbi:MAG TPA: hypothetical protein VEH84_15335 [Alphaproteobacteria bacterium]|nr:hypothetical protein [Alphaproteobacteria bacterium]
MPQTRIPLPSMNGFTLYTVTEVDDADGHETRRWIEILDADGDLVEVASTEEEAAAVVEELTRDGLAAR